MVVALSEGVSTVSERYPVVITSGSVALTAALSSRMPISMSTALDSAASMAGIETAMSSLTESMVVLHPLRHRAVITTRAPKRTNVVMSQE